MARTAAILLSLTAYTCFAQDRIAPRFEQLDNGLRIVVVEDHTLPLVSVQLWYAVGSAQDPPETPGLAHLLRHLLEDRDDDAARLRANGLDFNAYTMRDACSFETVAPASCLDAVLQIEAARMAPLTITNKALATAKQRAQEDAAPPPGDTIPAALYAGRVYAYAPNAIGDAIPNLMVADARQHLRTWFVPSNATLFITGDVSAVATIELARTRFGDLKHIEPPQRAEQSRLEPGSTERREVTGPMPKLSIGWATPRLGSFENAAIDVLTERLSNPTDGSMLDALRFAGMIGMHWDRSAWRDGGYVALSVLAAPDRLPQVETAIAASLEAAEKQPCTEIELQRARRLTLTRHEDANRTFRDRAHHLGAMQVIGGDALLVEYEREAIARVTVGDLQKAASELLKARMAVIQTIPGEEDVTAATTAAPTSPSVSFVSPASPPVIPPITHAAKAAQYSEILGVADLPPAPAQMTTQTITGSVELKLLQIDGLAPATIQVLADNPEFDGGKAITVLQDGAGDFTRDRLVDYTSLYGIRLNETRGATRVGLSATGPADRAASIIELQLRLIADTLKADGKQLTGVQVIAVGDFTNESIDAAVTAAWSLVKPAEDVKPAPPKPPTQKNRRLVELTVNPPAAYGDMLLATLRFPAPIDSRQRLIQEAGLWLLDPWINCPRRTSQGEGEVFSDDGYDRRAIGGRFEDIDYLEALAHSLTRLRSADVDADVLQPALRVARLWRLFELDSSLAIADAIAAGRDDPWDWHVNLNPMGLRSAFRRECRRWTVEIECSTDKEHLLSRLQKLDITRPESPGD